MCVRFHLAGQTELHEPDGQYRQRLGDDTLALLDVAVEGLLDVAGGIGALPPLPSVPVVAPYFLAMEVRLSPWA